MLRSAQYFEALARITSDDPKPFWGCDEWGEKKHCWVLCKQCNINLDKETIKEECIK